MKRALSIVLIAFFLVIGSVQSTECRSKGWALRYVKGAPSSENIYQREVYAEGQNHSMYTTVDSVTNGAAIKIEMYGEVDSVFWKPGRTHSVVRGMHYPIHSVASYYNRNYGNATNYPRGIFYY